MKHAETEIFHETSLLRSQRLIYMGSEANKGGEESGVDCVMAERFIKNLAILEADSQEPVTVIMNNIGGDVMHGFVIFDAIRQCTCYIKVVVYGHAFSMGSVILQAADERVMAENAVQMIHEGTSATDGHARTAKKIQEEYNRIDARVLEILLKRIEQKNGFYPKTKLLAMLDHDTFLTAQQSVDLGLADRVLVPTKHWPPKPSAAGGR